MAATEPVSPARNGRGHGQAQLWWVAGLVAVTVAVRLPLLNAPLSSDEGGLLLVAGQWHAHGSSLYGDYWVDRPPLLIAFFAFARALGGALALRLLGCVAAATAVCLSYALACRAGVSRALRWAAPVATTAFVSSPFFGAGEVNGELVAVPVVLAGLVAAWSAHGGVATGRERLGTWAIAGSLGMAAVMVKQNFVDVFVFAGALLVASTAGRQRTARAAARSFAALALGAAVAAALVLFMAWTRGTSGAALWDAVVVFRADAARVIGTSASAATGQRFWRLPLMLAISGAGLLLVLLFATAVRRPRRPLEVAVAALAGWEIIGIVGGGSYWLHYLLCLVPGLSCAVLLLAPHSGLTGRLARPIVVVCSAISLVACVWVLLVPPRPPDTLRVGHWLAASADVGDTAAVLYGQPSILEVAGLSSPYPELWSLPVRVRDPQLRQLTGILDARTGPTWLVVHGGIGSWGIDPQLAERAVATHYHPVTIGCGYEIYLRDGLTRDPLPGSALCR